jgi:hypothetical protein
LKASRVSVISSADLIQSKLAAGRPQDLLDVDAIREASKLATDFEPRRPSDE